MKIGITGDTHGSVQALRRVLKSAPPVDSWFYTGDYAHDAEMIARETKLPVVKVCGNCDSWENRAKPDIYLDYEGFKVWLTHGHKYLRVGGVEDLIDWAKKLQVDIVVFGHTHVPMAEMRDGILVVNPGSPALPRGGSDPTMAVLTLEKGQPPKAEILKVGKSVRFFRYP